VPNYALVDVSGTHPVTGQKFLIASAGSEIPAEYDSLVDAEDKSATAPTVAAQPNRETATLSTTAPAVAAAADADQVLGEAPFDGVVIGATYIPEANVTGDTTETRTVSVVNKGADGNGTTVIATLAFITGVNATDFDEKAFTLSAVAGATDVAEGDVLAVTSTHGGTTGLADPGGLVEVQINPR
jgi:hypothetical protein